MANNEKTAQPVGVLAVMDDCAGSLSKLGSAGMVRASELREARAAVAGLVEDLKRIQRRAAAHPDDNDADRKRNLYHIESIASFALARMEPQS